MTTYAFSKLTVDSPAPDVLRLLINRPQKRNAIDFDVRQQLIDVFTRLLVDGEARAVVLGGVGGHFSAGGDIPSMLNLSDSEARQRMRHIALLCRLVHGTGIPVVTALEGVSAGACVGLALLGDYIVAGEHTKIIFPFMKLGLIPDWGLLYTLPRRVGLPAARRLLTTSETMSVGEALQTSLVDEVVADADVMATAVRCAVRFSKLPLAAFARFKVRLNKASSTLDEDLMREESDQAGLLQGPDFREGYAAFVERRPADFVGRTVRK